MTNPQTHAVKKMEPFWWAAEINSMIKEGRSVQAVKALDALMDKNLDRNYVLLYKVRLLQRMGRLKEAIAWVCLETELRPADPQIVALKDEMMAQYPYSLFEARPTVDLLSSFRKTGDEWPEVAGMQEIKIQLHNDLILPIRHREKFQRFGVELPNGILFYGPPGCGKTYIARRLADKIGYNFYELKLSHIGSPYIHQMATSIGKMFQYAAQKNPMVLFLDEVDSLGTDRDSPGVAANRLEEVNELLKQMDRCHERGILVIGACNAIDRVDGALKRPGRFDKQVYIGPPDAAARDDLFRHFMKDKPAAENIDYNDLVKHSEGYSNADIEAVVKEAAKIAAIQDAPKLKGNHLKTALDNIPSSLGVSGKRRSKQIGF
jgi:transitional endoplasmic reticulum ATPase